VTLQNAPADLESQAPSSIFPPIGKQKSRVSKQSKADSVARSRGSGEGAPQEDFVLGDNLPEDDRLMGKKTKSSSDDKKPEEAGSTSSEKPKKEKEKKKKKKKKSKTDGEKPDTSEAGNDDDAGLDM
jgi:hypothetical protein